ncbi:MAG: hypothetical protein K2Q45_03785, partial [Nitrosomonas sp.]|nr:hypothetical protein [Nitrosomonas sp.]
FDDLGIDNAEELQARGMVGFHVVELTGCRVRVKCAVVACQGRTGLAAAGESAVRPVWVQSILLYASFKSSFRVARAARV